MRVAVRSREESTWTRFVDLVRDDAGYFSGFDMEGRSGDIYVYVLPEGKELPDPASRQQWKDVHGPSVVVDSRFDWTDSHWQRPAFRDLVIYEMHVGTFTSAGTFASACAKLPHLRDLGVNAVELMPIADHPGQRSWGYDGVLIYAPAACLGRPEDLREFVDQAHAHGIAVILDVVYNHFGPAGNYLGLYSKNYFNPKHQTPWGDGFNFDSSASAPVRDFFIRNPIYWMEEFHIDGFRMDATHAIVDHSPVHVLAEMTEAVRARGCYAIAEDEANSRQLLLPMQDGGLGFHAVWADDFHHTARVAVSGERHSYFAEFTGTMEEVLTALRDGWVYSGQLRSDGKPRGSLCSDLPPEQFVHCISNHDQVGNRALGERLSELIEPDAYRAMSVLLCLSPYTPMLFMGQEWAASTPFLYFTDHEEMLGAAITAGRRKEFAAFPAFSDPKVRSTIPDPQSVDTFMRSKLIWEETSHLPHKQTLELYRHSLAIRRTITALRPTSREAWRVVQLEGGMGGIHYQAADEEFLLAFDLTGKHTGHWQRGWHVIVSSEDCRFGGSGRECYDRTTGEIVFPCRGTILFRKNNT